MRLHKWSHKYSKTTNTGQHTSPDQYMGWDCITNVGVHSALGVTRMITPVFFSDMLNSERYIGQTLTSSFENLSEKEDKYEFHQQHAANPLSQ
jgi:hypothetical protein